MTLKILKDAVKEKYEIYNENNKYDLNWVTGYLQTTGIKNVILGRGFEGIR